MCCVFSLILLIIIVTSTTRCYNGYWCISVSRYDVSRTCRRINITSRAVKNPTAWSEKEKRKERKGTWMKGANDQMGWRNTKVIRQMIDARKAHQNECKVRTQTEDMLNTRTKDIQIADSECSDVKTQWRGYEYMYAEKQKTEWTKTIRSTGTKEMQWKDEECWKNTPHMETNTAYM